MKISATASMITHTGVHAHLETCIGAHTNGNIEKGEKPSCVSSDTFSSHQWSWERDVFMNDTRIFSIGMYVRSLDRVTGLFACYFLGWIAMAFHRT